MSTDTQPAPVSIRYGVIIVDVTPEGVFQVYQSTDVHQPACSTVDDLNEFISELQKAQQIGKRRQEASGYKPSSQEKIVGAFLEATAGGNFALTREELLEIYLVGSE